MLLDSDTIYPHVHLDLPLEEALERLGDSEREAIAILDRADARRVLGIVTLTGARATFRASNQRR